MSNMNIFLLIYKYLFVSKMFVGFGNFFGFLFIWTRYLILRPADAAVNSLSFATYLAEQFFPQECSNAETKGK